MVNSKHNNKYELVIAFVLNFIQIFILVLAGKFIQTQFIKDVFNIEGMLLFVSIKYICFDILT